MTEAAQLLAHVGLLHVWQAEAQAMWLPLLVLLWQGLEARAWLLVLLVVVLLLMLS